MRSGYASRLADFGGVDPSLVVGRLSEATAEAGYATQLTRQTEVWRQEVLILQDLAKDVPHASPAAGEWYVVLEYEIPRRQKRPDAIILADDVVAHH